MANLQVGDENIVLDEVSSSDVAAAVAGMTEMLVAEQVIAQAESLSISTDLTNATEDQLAKPQLVATEIKTAADITKHTVAEGDTIDSLASDYNVTTDTIRWANSLKKDKLDVGSELTILPVTGTLHTVAEGDTPESIAQLYKSDARQVIAFNDAEVKGLAPGQQVVVPDGAKPAPARSLIRNILNNNFLRTGSKFSSSYTIIGGKVGNGWCVAYAEYRSAQLGNPTGGGWGNARVWPSSARQAGRTVDRTPVVGAVAQRNNHVAVVEAVSEDGSMIKYSDQNGVGGWGRVALTNDWVPASSFAWFIH